MNNESRKNLEIQRNMTASQRSDYQNNQRQIQIENKLLRFVNNGMLHLFVAGGAGSRFADEENLSFTNAGIVLNAIYNVYEKYPDLKIDNLLEQALIKLLSSDIGYVYTALNTIDLQLHNEMNGASPFKIDNPAVFSALRESVIKNLDYLKSSADYRGRLYDNKLYGYVEAINKRLEEQKGVKIL